MFTSFARDITSATSVLEIILTEQDMEMLAKGESVSDSVTEVMVVVKLGNPEIYGTSKVRLPN